MAGGHHCVGSALIALQSLDRLRPHGREEQNLFDQLKRHRSNAVLTLSLVLALSAALALTAAPLAAQRDPAEPLGGKPAPKVPQRLASAIARSSVDEAGMRSLIQQLVACGTRNSLSSWDNPKRGVGCGRDAIVARWEKIARDSGGKLQIVVDKFEGTSGRTNGKPVPFENVYGIFPGSDPALAKTIFVVSGHMDSRASDVMDPEIDAPGADDDASGVAVSMECARLLTRAGSPGPAKYRATLLFAAVSGEEQGLVGSEHMLKWLKDEGYTVGGRLDNDIVGADQAAGRPHRVRVFSGNGNQDDADSPSRELARAVEEIDGRDAIRLIFSLDRLGRGGDHRPFYEAGFPAVRFTEPLEDYRHQHQTVRVENGIEYGDRLKYLNYTFIGDVARDNAETLRELALAPAAPKEGKLTGGVTPSAWVSWAALNGPERAAFEILWRETSDPRRHVYDFTTSAGETTLMEVSTENHFFAVHSVRKNGTRSIATSVGALRAGPDFSVAPK